MKIRQVVQKSMKEKISQEDVSLYRVNSVLPEGSRLTRYGSAPIKIGEASFDFLYRRDSFEFNLEKDKLKYIGIPKIADDTAFKIFLTNSGQAAINAVYFYLDKFAKIHEIESHNDYLYVGAYRLQDIYQIKHSKRPSRCLWICSTATKFENALKVNGEWEIVVVDTTCWAVGSEELQQVYDKFKSRGLVIFFRSHSKLDMGGVEYGSMGNLTIFSDDEKLIQETSHQFQNILGLSGGYAVLDDIPPYLFTENFYDLSKRRVKRIVDNTRNIERFLFTEMMVDIKYGEFIFPDHYKYFFIRLKRDTPESTIEILVKKFNFLLNMYLPEAKSCASFGFNFPSVTFYKSDEGIGHFFRFSTGTVSEEENQKLAFCIKEVFQK